MREDNFTRYKLRHTSGLGTIIASLGKLLATQGEIFVKSLEPIQTFISVA